MKMRKLNIPASLLFLSMIIWETTSIQYDPTVIDAMRNKLLQLEKILERNLFDERFQGHQNEKYLHVIMNFKSFGDELEQNISSSGYENLNALSSVWLWARTETELKAIDGLYRIMRLMQKQIIEGTFDDFDQPKLFNFLETILHDPNASIVRILERIGNMIINEKLFVSAYKEAASQICNENQSLQQLLYNLYTTVTLAEIKGYSMIQFSYKLLRLYNPGTNFTEEMKLVKQQYERRTIETLRAVKTAMAFAPRHIWKCDARIHKLDETYTTLRQLLQGYIVNEVDLNKDSSCKENCAAYSQGYSKVYGCYDNQLCAQQRKCNGRVLKCEYIDSDMWICPSSAGSDRRYEYIEYENGKVFGQKDTCRRSTTKIDSWWRWLFWHCSYCFCYCDDNNVNSDRYFSLRQVVSDVENNKVVTGIRFKKVKQIIHIQIQEGELMPRGMINASSVQWQPIDSFSVLDNNVKNGVDYHTMSWENRGLDLDDLVLDQNYLLTGLKFRTIGSRLNLEVRMTNFNFTTGKLIKPSDRSFWVSHDRTDRTELKLENPDIPTRLSLLTLPDSKSEEQYLNFAPSDRRGDAAQNTIPFLDIQPVESKPPVPIAGAGIFHKGRHGSGGYVALRLITYDFSQHLKVDLSPTIESLVSAPNGIKVV